MSGTKATAQEVRQIAAAANADERTVRRWLSGDPVRGVSDFRIADAVEKLGMKFKRGRAKA